MIEQIKKLIQKAVPEEKEIVVEIPELESHGHYATNIAMRLAKSQGKSPMEIAESIAAHMRENDTEKFFEKIEIAPPGFINFWLSKKTIHETLHTILKAGKKWGRGNEKKQTVVIDYSHPNIAKPMGVHHLRSTIIGDALYRIFTFVGWKTISDNHLGDWGKQFGILIAAWKETKEKPKEISINFLMHLYVDYTARMKQTPALEEAARREIKKLQDGDKENLRIWKLFYKISLTEFKKIYKILGIRFDYYLGESVYQPMLKGIIEDALEKGIAQKSEGAIIIPVEGKAPFIIQKSDEAFLYSTTDLAAIIHRNKKFKPTLALYVVDNGQSLHFEQLFYAAKQLGYTRGEKLAHVKFGLILGVDLKKLSTRSGKHIELDALLEEAVARAGNIVKEKRPELSPKKHADIARKVGIGAVKYNDLSQNRQSDIAFEWEKMLNFEGNSAPYLLYTYARLKSIVRKGGRVGSFEATLLETSTEQALIRKLINFPAVLEEITKSYFPHHLTEYLFELAQEANAFYHSEPVLKAEPALRKARLALVAGIAQTLQTGLNLLGIEAPEEM